MKEKINIAEILKDCQNGMELDCTMYEDVHFDYIDEFNTIHCYIQWETYKTSLIFNQYGSPDNLIKSKCVIFPKGKTDWKGFVPPCKFKDGDVLYIDCNGKNGGTDKRFQYIFILKEISEDAIHCHCYISNDEANIHNGFETCNLASIKYRYRLATSDEKQKLFQVIKDNGYKWNPETKTLEKLVQPKFKVGDQIVKKNSISNSFIVNRVSCEYYGLQLPDKSGVGVLNVNEQDDWEVLPQYFFNNGDIIAKDGFIVIFSHSKQSEVKVNEQIVYYHCYLKGSGYFKSTKDCGVGYISDFRFASESEKQKLFNAIKENGYKWNAETKTLEKLIEPKFKSGDKIVKKNDHTECWYVQGIDSYCGSYHYNIVTKGKFANLYLKDQDDWELVPVPKFKVGDIVKTKRNKLFDYKIIKITDTHYTLESIPGANTYDILICEDENWKLVPNKFDINTLKPFESKVLVRDFDNGIWEGAIFGRYDGKKFFTIGGLDWECCIPYKGNEHLHGTTNDCDDFYKNW